MVPVGYSRTVFSAARDARMSKEGSFVHCQGGRPLGVDPDQKAVKEKVSVQTEGIAALVCCLLTLPTLFKGLPLILIIKET